MMMVMIKIMKSIIINNNINHNLYNNVLYYKLCIYNMYMVHLHQMLKAVATKYIHSHGTLFQHLLEI